MFDRLTKGVKSGDIVMVFPSSLTIQAADIWIVRSCSDENSTMPRTDSVMVSMGRYSRKRARGRWSMFGPEVFYTPNTSELDSNVRVKPLSEVLQPLRRTYPQYDNIRIIPKPHGREVFRDYFQKMCPLCCNEYWNCFDENFDEMFPRLVTETGAEQACPVCMGEDFAEMDVEFVEQLEEYKAQLGQGTNPDDLSEDEFEECKNKFLALVRERYKILNVRRAEMGLPWMWDIEDRVRRHRRVFIEDKDPVDTSSESESDEEEETDFDDGDDDDLDDDDGDGDDGDDGDD